MTAAEVAEARVQMGVDEVPNLPFISGGQDDMDEEEESDPEQGDPEAEEAQVSHESLYVCSVTNRRWIALRSMEARPAPAAPATTPTGRRKLNRN